jgi:hypothetical protein
LFGVNEGKRFGTGSSARCFIKNSENKNGNNDKNKKGSDNNDGDDNDGDWAF